MFDMFNELWAMLASIFRGTKKFALSYEDLGTAANVKTQSMVGDMFISEADALSKYEAYQKAVAAMAAK